MEKIQTDVVSMVRTAVKTGGAYQAPGVDAAFNKLLKEQNQTAGSKTKDAAASEKNSQKEASDIGKEETKPVKESGQKGKTEDAGMEEELQSAGMVPSELLLQFQESAGRLAMNLAEEAVGVPDQPEESLEAVLQPEGIVFTETAGAGTAAAELLNQEALAEAVESLGVEEPIVPVLPAADVPTETKHEEAVRIQPERAVPEKTAATADVKTNVQETKPAEPSESPPETAVQEVSVKAAAETEKGNTEEKESQGETQQHFAGIAEQPREYGAHEMEQVPSEPVRTSEPALADDVGRAIAQRFPAADGTLTIELEPVSLGKLTISVLYESGKATVSILATNPRTLELLNTKAAELASIIEERTGQETIVYTEQPADEQPFDERQGEGQQRERRQENQEHKEKTDQDSFLQQLRLGFI